MGCNAIRFSHNPPSTHMLDACDKHGMLVINEAFDEWTSGKAMGYAPVFDKFWKKDMNSMLYRDRNHPSVIMWSIGNEVKDQGTTKGIRIAEMLSNHVKGIDPTRPTTIGVQPGGPNWSKETGDELVQDFMSELFSKVDICGYNYQNMSSRWWGGDFQKTTRSSPAESCIRVNHRIPVSLRTGKL